MTPDSAEIQPANIAAENEPTEIETQSATSVPSKSVPSRRRRHHNPPPHEGAGKAVQHTVASLHQIINKEEAPEDDCDRYAKILANKLRKLPENKRLQFLYEVDGTFIQYMNQRSTLLSSALYNITTSLSPTVARRPSSHASSSNSDDNPQVLTHSDHSLLITNLDVSPAINLIEDESYSLPQYSHSLPAVTSPSTFCLCTTDRRNSIAHPSTVPSDILTEAFQTVLDQQFLICTLTYCVQ